MEKTAKRIGIAIVAILLVALVCAGIALSLPQAETPLSSEGSADALDTAVRSVTAGDVTYDLTDWQQANAYYDHLISPDQGYTPITDQPSLQKFLNDNGGNSGAKGAMKPYSNTGSPITYTFGQHSTDADFGSNMGVDGVFKATLDGCGANVTLKVNHEWNGKHSKQSSGTDALTHAGITSDASYFRQVGDLSLTGTLANSASGATVKNLNMNISEAEEVINGAKNNGVFVGGLFGAMYNTTIDNCSLNITAAITGTKEGSSDSSAGHCTFAFGGIAAYALGSTISNFSLNLGADINIVSNGIDKTIDDGNPRGAAGGAIAISQDVTMYNIILKGGATVRAYIDDHWFGNAFDQKEHIARAGALVGISISPSNAEALTFGATSSSSGVTAINGVLTNYTGTATGRTVKYTTKNDVGGQYVLIGSSEGGAISNLYWYGDTAPTADYGTNSSYTATAVNATADKGTAQISFKNETGAVSSLSGLQVTYTAPPDSGSILWSYNDSGAPGEGLDMYSAQPYETYTIQWPRTLTKARNVTFTTGRKVKYTVQYTMTGGGDTNITDQGGMDADPVDTKQFDNKAFASPVLRVLAIDGSSLGDITDQSYWSISKGELTSSWTTAVDVGTYNVRLIDAFNEDTAYDFIDADQKFIAYKSDNSNGASRNYVFKITQRELSLSITTEPPFVYDNQTKSLEFVLNTIADGDDTPSVIATYFDKNQSQIDASQVIGAGDYYVTVTGVNDPNYYVNADDLTEHTMWKFTVAQRKITITPSGYEGLVYNGAPQYPTVEIGNRISENDNQVVTLNYYGSADPNRPLNIDERINVDSYKMIARLSDPANYVLDNSDLTASETVSFDDSSVTISYNIAKADLKFVGETTISFVYSRSVVRTLQALNTQAGTSCYFQPVDENNTTDKDIGSVGSDVVFNIIDGPATNNVSNVGTYTIELSYESDNFNAISETITAEVTKKQLTLNFNEPYETQFVYGEQPNYTFDAAATGAVSADEVVFDIVYYVNDGDGTVKEENKLDYVPKNAGSYIAAIEVVGAATEAALGNYDVDDSGNSKIAYTIDKANVEIAFTGYETALTYNGTEQNPVTIEGIDGIIASEQGLYNKDTLKVTYTKDDSTADTARNAGTYNLSVAPINAEDTAFANNYNVATAQTLTIDKAPLSLQLLDVTMDYASATGQAIPYGEGVTHNFVEGQIFDGDDVQEDPNEWLLQIYTLDENDGSELTINGIGTYLFSIRLNPTNSNAGNYELTLTDSEAGAEYPNAPEGVGTLTVEGTAVFHGIRGTSESGFAVMEEPTEPFAYNIDVTYRGEDIKFSFFTRTTAGSLEGLSFDEFVVEGAVKSGLDETTGYPFVVVRNVGTYTATWTLAAQSQNIFFFPTEDGSTSDQNSLTVTINVGKLDAEIVPNDVSVVYGGTIEYAGFSVVGDEDGTKAAALAADNVQVKYDSTTQSTANVDNYDGAVTITGVTFDGTLGDNYNITYNTGSAALAISPRPVTVSVTAAGSAVYGDGAPEITAIAAAEGSNTIIDGDADGLIAGLNADGVLDLANRNVGSTKIVIVEGKNEIGNYTVTLAEDTGVVQVTPKKIIVDVADGIVPYGATEADIRPANGVYFNGEPEFAYDDATKEFVFKIAGGGVDLTTQEPATIPSVLQIAFVDETLNGNYEFEFTNGDLTVEAMTLEAGQVRVELEKDTYDGTVIGYDIFVGTVNVTDADPTRLIVTINGSRDTEILNAGEYVFAIEGDGDYYKGNVTVTVTVKQADISDMDFGLDKTSATYTGSEIQVSANTRVPVALAITNADGPAELINAGTYTVTVTPTDPNYTGSKTFEFTIDKAPHKAPVKDDLTIEVAWDSVTVTHDEFTVQLSKDGTEWVDTTMEGYDANSSYTLHVRFKEDANHSASSNTIMISGKTAERTAVEFTIAGVEEHYNRAVLTITFEEAFSGKVQFSIDGGKTWKDLTVQDGKYVASGLAESSEYTLQVKIPAGDDYLESDPQSVKVKTGIDPAKYTETLAMFGETFSAGDLVNYETLKEQFNGLTEADKAGVDAAKFATITAARDAFVASVNSDIEDIQNVAAKTAGRAVAAAAAAVTAAAIALFIAKRKFI